MSTQTAQSIFASAGDRRNGAAKALPFAEVVNTITHGVGIPLSLAGAALLLLRVSASGDALRIIACAVYSATLAGVFTASTLSHCFVCPIARHRFRALDQGLIYLLIVGSFTPFSIAFLQEPIWRAHLGVMWIIAIWGFASKIGYSHRVDAHRIWSYLLLAVLGAIPAFSTYGAAPQAVHGWVFLGGGAFLLGVLFFLVDLQRYHFHAIWHLLVIAGCACHYVGIYYYVA